jgi:3-hydroxyacyl-CoA dehydrogenase/3-hydroxy-2-methylbutyryl-CoA dehydrogenase
MDPHAIVALITGAASGMGEATARMVVARGGRVMLADLAGSNGRAIADELGEQARFEAVDITNQEQVRAAIDGTVAAFGRLDVTVNAAGISGVTRVLHRDGHMFDMDQFRHIVDVNLVGTYDVIRNSVRVMRENPPNAVGERGVIVTVGSISAFDGQVGHSAYSASKGALVAMTLPLARELSDYGIRVVTICPGSFDTAMLAAVGDDLRDRILRTTAFPKRLGQPSEFAQFALAVVENPMLNGESIRLDGGNRLGHPV